MRFVKSDVREYKQKQNIIEKLNFKNIQTHQKTQWKQHIQ